ncbi:ABC transporter substrate-binding protein [Falsiroseomonas selenitidurans]|uniref:Extracellular solute-binding protein n=1 Tax=Falsiroseomonas selenitidurans TaxID=2716335 RepID=A0ABX1E911_9PROT|nr:extracellular solute-binding protein [Falsiroseomonas selenitidurans]NKC33521.1 extracellular solute-binding protein [Falsiroseomonas selenitidurans]OYW10205.1 MAG: Tat pathway signal protein [Rhodospirillales bacterium 12-71-4]
MSSFTKRQILTLGTGIMLGGGAAFRAAAQGLPAHERQLYEAAQREGEITWYSGQYNAETSEAIGRAFNERYPGVRCNVVRSTSQVAFQRLSQDARANVAQCDVFSSTNSGHFVQLKRQGRLMQYRPQNADGMLPAIRNADAENFFHTSFLGLFLMTHNTRLVPEAEAPKSWTDALDGKWKNKLAVGHPGFSGAIGVWAVQMRKMYGWDYFTRLERNNPQIGRSSQDPVTTLNAGERSVGLCVPVGTTQLAISRGNPLKLIYPTEGVLATIAPSAIIANAPHPNAARLFMEFQAGKGLSETVRKTFNEPLRPDVAPPEGGRPLADVTLLAPSLEEQEKGVPEVREAWRDTFGV